MQTKLTLPNGEQFDVLHSVPHGGTVSNYYNGIRRGWITEDHPTAKEYRRLLPSLMATLVASIEASGIEFDTVVLAPSSRRDAVPFMAAIVQRWPNARDIMSTFGRQGVAKAADPGGAEVMGKELVHTPDGKEKDIKSLLIVDESVAEGKTAAAIIEHLRAAGMSKDVKVTLAVCCRMK